MKSSSRGLDLFGALVLIAGVVGGWVIAARDGFIGGDFATLYEMARGIATGTNVYDVHLMQTFPERYGAPQPPGMFYPPATGFSVLPLVLLPYEAAKITWFLVMTGAVVFGIRALVRLLSPASGNHVWMISAGFVLFSASMRWGMTLLQGAPLMFGLLCFLIVALHRGHPRAAVAIAVVATCFKMTLALPFLGLLALHRRFGAAVLSGAVWVGLNVLGMLRMGSAAFADYRVNMATVEAIDNMNAPDPWAGVALPRLDWVFLINGIIGNLPASRILALSLSAIACAWLAFEGFRARFPPSLWVTGTFAAAFVCLGSLCVYHHHYDACLFFVPVLFAAFGDERLRRPRFALWLSLPLVVIISVLPIGRVQGMLFAALGAPGVALLKLSFPVVFTLAFAGVLVVLRRQLAAPAEAGDLVGTSPEPPSRLGPV